MVGCAVLLGLAVGFIMLSALIPFATSDNNMVSVTSIGKDKVAVVELFGPIMDAHKVVKQLDRYGKDSSIKGIILHIDSPGGGVAPSQEIYQAALRAKKNKPLVASLGSLAASGGYYAAIAADKIVSNPGTITGSIGVIIGFMDARELMKKIGVRTINVKSGKFKDIGSSGREFTEEDKKVIQAVIDDVYGQFVEAVAAGRNMEEAAVRKLADGRIYSGRQALELGLVDELGTYHDAIQTLKKLANIDGKVTVVREEEKLDFLKELLSERLGFDPANVAVPALRPGVHYLWTN